MLVLLFIAVLLLTYANGANDNFKGVATLWGSRTLNYKTSLLLATIATFTGSVCSYFFAEELLKNFSGQGLIPDNIIQAVDFVLAVALGAGVTVILATYLGFPISTTHGLVGALVGAGSIAVGSQVNFIRLGTVFFLPLLSGPFIAVIMSTLFYRLLHYSRKAAGINEKLCVCAGQKTFVSLETSDGFSRSLTSMPSFDTKIGTPAGCRTQYEGRFLGIDFETLLNNLHYTSAAIVSFARGLNDTPKLVSLLMITNLFKIPVYIGILAVAMAVGGLLNAKKVAATMSKKISKLNHGQGFTANLITGGLVIAASQFGLPVSTTHVSVGSIYGIVSGTGNSKEIFRILLSWIITLPVAAILSALFYFIFNSIIK